VTRPDYAEKIPNNVGLADDRRLARALESWQPDFLSWWETMGPTLPTQDVYLRTAIDVRGEGWAQFGHVPMIDYRWGIFLADRNPDRRIAFGQHKGEPAWQKVPGEYRAELQRLIVIQGDTEPASVEQQRNLGATAPSLYDLRNLFQVNVEEGRHLWAMVYLLHAYFGREGREEAEELLHRNSGSEDSPRILGAFNEETPDWLAREIVLYLKRTLKRLDVTSRSLIALLEPGSCFAGSLLELALAADRSYLLSGVFETVPPTTGDADAAPAAVTVGAMNLGPLPMGNGLTRLATRFLGDPEALSAAEKALGEPLEAAGAERLGLVTFAPDDIDWEEEVRIAVEERASFSPDALTGLEANYRFAGPETIETKIFGRLTAWQNWIFYRPNASGPDGALRAYGTGKRADFDRKRV